MERIAVLGTGTMGAGIVQLAAQSGYRVTACDTSVEALERAQVYVHEGLERLAAKSAFSEDEASSHYDRIHWTTNPQDLAEHLQRESVQLPGGGGLQEEGGSFVGSLMNGNLS